MKKSCKKFFGNIRYDLYLGSIFTILAVFFVILSVQHGMMLSGVDSPAIQTFEGKCTITAKKYHRNTVYLLNLENGDTVLVQPKDLLTDDTPSEMETKKLIFQYSSFRSLTLSRAHMPVNIFTADGEHTMLLDADAVQLDYICLCVFWALLAIVCFALVVLIVWLRTITKKKKPKGKSKRQS